MEVSFKKHSTELGYVLFKNTYVFILRKSSSVLQTHLINAVIVIPSEIESK